MGGEGGAIYNEFAKADEPITVTNSTLFRNSAEGPGGGIKNASGTLSLVQDTFAGNGAPSGGGAVDNSGMAHLFGTILARNPGGGTKNCAGTIVDEGYNISDDMTCGFGGQNPLLDKAGLKDNGGPTQTISLQPGNPAIDLIPFHARPTKFDQRGELRPDPEDGTDGPCDVGAFEVQESRLGAKQTCGEACNDQHASCVNASNDRERICYDNCRDLPSCLQGCLDDHRNAQDLCKKQLDDCMKNCPPM